MKKIILGTVVALLAACAFVFASGNTTIKKQDCASQCTCCPCTEDCQPGDPCCSDCCNK